MGFFKFIFGQYFAKAARCCHSVFWVRCLAKNLANSYAHFGRHFVDGENQFRLFYFILFYFILFYFILFYFILFTQCKVIL